MQNPVTLVTNSKPSTKILLAVSAGLSGFFGWLTSDPTALPAVQNLLHGHAGTLSLLNFIVLYWNLQHQTKRTPTADETADAQK